jgi:aspartyl-tRNA(Asn)/glutamyl-tRNA(Gln) amidotransferase subunit B
MRSKESAHDYRYFPEPDLPPFTPDDEFFQRIQERLVELPHQRKVRFIKEFDVQAEHAEFLCEEKETADFFEAAVRSGGDPQTAASWLGSDVQKICNREGIDLADSKLTAERFAGFTKLFKEGKINSKIGKEMLEVLFKEGTDPEIIMRERGWEQIGDRNELEGMVEKVIAEQIQAVQQIAGGDLKPLGFLVGQVMKISEGKADPRLTQKILKEKLQI